MSSALGAVVLAALVMQGPAADATAAATAAAEALSATGDLQGAADAYRRLLDDAAADRARVLYRLAGLERRLGRPDAAEATAVEAAGLLDARHDPSNASEALNLAGMAATDAGRYQAAAARFDAAIARSAAAGAWARHAEQVGNLGTVHFLTGRYDEAARAFDRAGALARDHAGEPWAAGRTAVVRANQAALLQRLGRYTDALAIYRAMLGPDVALGPAQFGQVLVNEGALFRRLGDPYKALDAYADARARFAAGRDAGSEAAVLTNRGIALALDLGRLDEAAAAFGEALAVATAAGNRREALLARLYRGESHRRAGRLADAAEDFAGAATLAAALDAREEVWKAGYGRGRVLLAEGRRADAITAFDAAMDVVDGIRERLAVPSTRAEFFQDKREVFDARIAAGLATDGAAATFALVERSRARAWRERLALPAVTLAAVQARLPAGTVMLAYWMSPLGSALVRVTSTGAAVTALEVAADDIRALDAAVRQPGNDRWTAPAAALGRALLPDGALAGAERVVVVPDGALGVVPFDALLVDGRPLVERVAVSTVPTAGVVLAPAPAPAGRVAPWTPYLAAFGDPVPGTDTWAGADGPRLAGGAEEVRALDAALGGAHRVFLGEANRKEALAAALEERPRVLHLATHAVADLAVGERSRLVFSPATPEGPADSLFLREVYGLPLDGVDLAVLSACETERGPEVRGEGVQGFSRALLAAGARRAITTLWRVPDRPTAALMRAFYRGVHDGQPIDRALADAKRWMAGQPALAHPHYWAAFVLTGPAGPAPAALRWRDAAGGLLVAAGLAAGLAAAAVLWRRRSA
ncbi:MAG: CHAT domain-containing protein [Vicinamibacterales bacterium]